MRLNKIELQQKPITQERKQNNEPEDFEKKEKERKPEWETAVKQGDERAGRAEDRLELQKAERGQNAD